MSVEIRITPSAAVAVFKKNNLHREHKFSVLRKDGELLVLDTGAKL